MTIVRGLSLARTLPNIKPGTAVLVRPVTTSIVRRDEGYVAENKKMGRPLSPSLKLLFANPEPVWMLSIGHRVTGCILTPTLSIMSIAYVASGANFTDFVKGLEPLYQCPAVWGSLKFLLAFPFAYHSFNGLRHLYWDTGRGFTMQFTYRAGFTALILGALTGIGLAMYTPSK